MLAWFRQRVARKCDSSRVRRRGRTSEESVISELVLRIARDDAGWGRTTIRDGLRGLRTEIGRSAVASCTRKPESHRHQTKVA